jgi:hypothetical protein
VTTALSTDLRTDKAAFEPANLAEALHISQVLVASRLLPRSITTPEAAFTVIATGRELGLSAMQALRSIHIVEGKPTLSADLMVALVKRHEVCAYFRLVESTASRAAYETHRKGEPSPTRMAYSIEEARAAGATNKDNWRKFPASMLRARAASMLARAVYPDVILGVYDPDEIADVPAAIVDVSSVPSRVEVPVRRAEPRPQPAAVVQDVEPVAEVSDVSPALAAALAAVDSAPDLRAARESLLPVPSTLTPTETEAAFTALMGRCNSASECNDAATLVVAWRGSSSVTPELVESLRLIYRARKVAVSEVA